MTSMRPHLGGLYSGRIDAIVGAVSRLSSKCSIVQYRTGTEWTLDVKNCLKKEE